jgi:hypothetical protein
MNKSKADTEFSRMLGYFPETALKSRIWYADMGRLKKLNHAEDITSLSKLYSISEERRQTMVDWSPLSNLTNLTGPPWTRGEIMKI